ncbi:glycosyl hydrolase [Cupriavidus sp. IDO]|nr:glycosyl hydrolase [Cupriavidus sp. IDO]
MTANTAPQSPAPDLPAPDTGPVRLLIATLKGAWFLTSDDARKTWTLDGPVFLGHTIHHIVQDPRDPGLMLMAARTGHLGPTVFRSTDGGRNWTEASRPPAFPKAPEGEKGRVVDHVFWLTPGHASEPGAWYAGTSPQGLFRTTDNGDTWDPVAGFNDHPMWRTWTGGEQDGTPDGPKLHSILVDPRDARHLYIGMSSGGVFESTDAGADWKPLNRGSVANFLADPNPEYGQDPHCVLQHPAAPDILYQQNHCGIYRMDRREGVWKRIGDAMPRDVGDIGFPIVAHRRDPRTVWVFPMDGTDVWPRVSPEGKPAVYVTRDAGETWQRKDRGLPASQAWFTVKRQAMAADAHGPVGVYFGTTGGEVWASTDEGEAWQCIASHLPHIYAVQVARPASR